MKDFSKLSTWLMKSFEDNKEEGTKIMNEMKKEMEEGNFGIK